MSSFETRSRADTLTGTGDEVDSDMQRRVHDVRRFRDRYESLMNRTGFGSKESTKAILRWFDEMEPTDDTSNLKSIRAREDFMEKDKTVTEGERLMQMFDSLMLKAKPHLSQKSYEGWYARLFDTRERSSSESSFELKLKWVQAEMPRYVERWKKVSEDYDEASKHPRFAELVASDRTFADLKDREVFLNLHYEKRAGLIAAAKGALGATEKSQKGLYATASKKLEAARYRGVIGEAKVGQWLERMFQKNTSVAAIEAFVNGSGKTSLSGLIENWTTVKLRYDDLTKKAHERGEDSAPRGLRLVSATQFVSMHYSKRVEYVRELEHRLNDAKNVEHEQPIFLRIRHAMDMKDWADASDLIMEAKMMHLRDTDRDRLKSMESYVSRFRTVKPPEAVQKAFEAKKRMDEVMTMMGKTHPEVRPYVERLLRGPHANRSINQMRWITYNNVWCRTHGYLDDEKARHGASDDHTKLTKYRAERGLDIGKNNSMDFETADKGYFRKREHSKTRATYMHTNVESGGVMNALCEWLEREQDPRQLYWTTLCMHRGGEPMSENANRDLLSMMTELRSLTRTIDTAGYSYRGPNEQLKLKP